MSLTALFGIIIGAVLILSGIAFDGGLIMDFFSVSSILITIGGTLASTIANYPFRQFINMFRVAKNAFKKKDYDLNKTIERILELATMARREGLLSLDKIVDDIEEPFLKKGIMLVVDGTDPELVKNIMQNDLEFMDLRHQRGQAMFLSMAEYAPAYGMIGTLIGLINMLKNLDNTDALGAGMATALITTFYGVILANLIFKPIAGKLKVMSESEICYNELILEGLLSLQAGENPKIVEERLNSFVAKSIKKGQTSWAQERGETVNA